MSAREPKYVVFRVNRTHAPQLRTVVVTVRLAGGRTVPPGADYSPITCQRCANSETGAGSARTDDPRYLHPRLVETRSHSTVIHSPVIDSIR